MANGSFFGRFFRFIGRSIDTLRVFLGRLFFVLILVLVLAVLFGGPAPITVHQNSLVRLAPTGAIVEQTSRIAPGSLLFGANELAETPIQDVLATLERARSDARVRGVILELDEMTAVNPVNLERIGAALDEFKSSGKALVAHGQFFTQAQYYLASYADSIYMHPMGQLLLPGYGGNQLYFAELLGKLGIKMHIFRVGTHKAAVEPFTLNGMSEASRQNNQQLVDELWQRYINQIAENRGLSVAAVRSYAERFPELLLAANGDISGLAVRQGLIDDLVTPGQLQARLNALASASATAPARTISYRHYLAATSPYGAPVNIGASEIGVIVARGAIGMGEQPRGMIGADSLRALIRKARDDDGIKALVLRIDSPGGSAFASELIRQELLDLQYAGKPVVVSMAGTAASGGYWIAASADEIWASPATVTGSIGIFSMIPTFESSLEKMGVYADGVGTTPLTRADVLTGMSAELATVLQASIERQYRNFLQLVADGRGMQVAAVDAIAQGQVWSGAQAMNFGLVDNLGELEDAVAAAARLASADDYTWRYIEKPLSPGEQILKEMLDSFGLQARVSELSKSLAQDFSANIAASSSVATMHKVLRDVGTYIDLNDPGDSYAVCEVCVLLQR